jgi:small subunit ribosomal protein S8
MNDAVSDMIIRIKNAVMAGQSTTHIPYSNLKLAIAEKLKQRGFISDIAKRGKKVHRSLELTLGRKTDGGYRFSDVKRISKPGRRIYGGVGEIKPVRGGSGTLVISTPKGILLGDEAVKENMGGEFLFEIW